MRKIIGIGETILDIIFRNNQPSHAVPGGSTFNTLISLGRLGVPATFISEIGKDTVGDIIIDFMKKNGVCTENLDIFCEGKTPISLAFLDENNEARYMFYNQFPEERLNFVWPRIEKDDIIIFGSYFALNPALRKKVCELVEFAKERKAIIAGNWKMNMTPSQAVKLVEELKPLVVSDDVEVVYCVPAIDIVPVVEALKGTNVAVGAENMYFEEKGAYTGEISAEMLLDAGVKYVIIGHSERRDYFKEDDALLNKKVKKAIEAGLTPILCCGETLEQRESGVTLDWIRLQIKSDLAGVAASDVANMVIAYEPIWAIGTGKTATSDQAQEVCGAIRECVAEIYDQATADSVRIQYGGSVNAGNAAELFAKPDIDGGLVGGASLKADFGKIVNYK